jgi:hypothetical protein
MVATINLLAFIFRFVVANPFLPDVKVTVLRQSMNCSLTIENTSIVHLEIQAQVTGQEEYILDTYQKSEPIVIRMDSSRIISGFLK